MSGRVTAIDVDLSDSDRIFIGSASGGVWMSENGDVSWKPIFDDQNVLSIGSIEVNQNNPAEIWGGTGEGNPRNSINCGGGIYKSRLTKVVHGYIGQRGCLQYRLEIW